jgi:ABC-2 type transport system permease protein
MTSPIRDDRRVARPAAWWAATRTQAAVELRLTARRGENLLAIAVIPVAVLVFFASGSVVALPGGGGVDALLPASIALAIVATGLVNLGIATAYERSYGVLKRLGGSPLGRSGLVAAKVVSVAAIVAIQLVALVAVAGGPLGWRPGPDVAPLLVVVGALLGTVTFAALGLLLAGTLRAEGVLAVANGLFLAALLVGGILVPAAALPGPFDALVALAPSAALADLLRIGLGAVGDALRPTLVLVGWSVAAAVLAARTFRWD